MSSPMSEQEYKQALAVWARIAKTPDEHRRSQMLAGVLPQLQSLVRAAEDKGDWSTAVNVSAALPEVPMPAPSRVAPSPVPSAASGRAPSARSGSRRRGASSSVRKASLSPPVTVKKEKGAAKRKMVVESEEEDGSDGEVGDGDEDGQGDEELGEEDEVAAEALGPYANNPPCPTCHAKKEACVSLKPGIACVYCRQHKTPCTFTARPRNKAAAVVAAIPAALPAADVTPKATRGAAKRPAATMLAPPIPSQPGTTDPATAAALDRIAGAIMELTAEVREGRLAREREQVAVPLAAGGSGWPGITEKWGPPPTESGPSGQASSVRGSSARGSVRGSVAPDDRSESEPVQRGAKRPRRGKRAGTESAEDRMEEGE
ncbi:hypothetical protein BD626DRAFT_632068 [Schizophyllum amplum]|uniref:Zn(2)-C6 fungal-type domain-containing protein n=1 Tax=Schizophyllum amplum TaxID=97359 RepID=A0A550C8R1_9AGAR|nr:hypothetical protein BD626DRAFT_632068 [Auriculariopsis ampla]